LGGLYLLGGLIMIAGVIAFGILLFSTIESLSNDGQRVVVPGKQVINLSEPGEYHVYYETSSDIDGKKYEPNTRDLSGINLMCYDADTNEKISLRYPNSNSNYNGLNSSGYGKYVFTIESATNIVIEGDYYDYEGNEFTIRIAKNLIMNLFVGTLSAIGIMFASFALGGGIILFVAIKRNKYKKSLV